MRLVLVIIVVVVVVVVVVRGVLSLFATTPARATATAARLLCSAFISIFVVVFFIAFGARFGIIIVAVVRAFARTCFFNDVVSALDFFNPAFTIAVRGTGGLGFVFVRLLAFCCDLLRGNVRVFFFVAVIVAVVFGGGISLFRHGLFFICPCCSGNGFRRLVVITFAVIVAAGSIVGLSHRHRRGIGFLIHDGLLGERFVQPQGRRDSIRG